MSMDYDWTKFYVAAVLETDPQALSSQIETAQRAIGKRVLEAALDENERRAVVAALNALTLLGRESCTYPRPTCGQCRDENDVVTPLNGKTFLAKTPSGEIIVSLHLRCVDAWALWNDCQTLVPLKKPPNVNRTWLRRNVA
jgi:hypothetical protein